MRSVTAANQQWLIYANPNKASELGRIGGRNKSRVPAENTDPLPKLDKVTAVRDVVEKLIADVYAGKLPPRVAAGLAPLLNLQLRVVQATDFDQRLAQLERLMATEAGGDQRGYDETAGHDFRKASLVGS